jgi:hypothetical protein
MVLGTRDAFSGVRIQGFLAEADAFLRSAPKNGAGRHSGEERYTEKSYGIVLTEVRAPSHPSLRRRRKFNVRRAHARDSSSLAQRP